MELKRQRLDSVATCPEGLLRKNTEALRGSAGSDAQSAQI